MMSIVMCLEAEVPNLVNRWWQKADDSTHRLCSGLVKGFIVT